MSCGLARRHRSVLARSVVLTLKYDRSCYLVNMASHMINQRQLRATTPARRRRTNPRRNPARCRIAGHRRRAAEGLSIGNLAAATGISKSGLYAHFGSKQELQLATVDEAERILAAEVVQPGLAARPGLAQLAAVCEAFFSYVQRRVFPGGCFFAATALEMGTRPGPVKDRVAAIESGFVALLRSFAVTALEQHELPADEDPDRLAFELHAILLAADTKFVLHDDPAVLDTGTPGRPQAVRTEQRQKRRRHRRPQGTAVTVAFVCSKFAWPAQHSV